MSINALTFFTLVVSFFLLLSGCGGSSESNDSPEEVERAIDNSFTVEGTANKGPFFIGSEVIINILNENGFGTDETIVTRIENSVGEFKFELEDEARMLVSVSGYHLNELTGGVSDGTLTLRGIFETSLNGSHSISVNILTHLLSDRIQALWNEGESFEDAKNLAELELITELKKISYVPEIEDFTTLSLYQGEEGSEGNAYLLAISSAVYAVATERSLLNASALAGELSLLISQMSNDFSNDGEINNSDMIETLIQQMSALDFKVIAENLAAHSLLVTGEELVVAVPKSLPELANIESLIGQSSEAGTYQVEISWDKIDEEDAYYQIEIYADELLQQLVSSLESQNEKVNTVLSSGVYTLRARVKNEDGLEGDWVVKEINVGLANWMIPTSTYGLVRDAVTLSDGYLLAFSKSDSGYPGIHYFLKLTAEGETQWIYETSAKFVSAENMMVQLENNEMIISASEEIESFSTYKELIVKLDSNGLEQWRIEGEIDSDIEGSFDKLVDPPIIAHQAGLVWLKASESSTENQIDHNLTMLSTDGNILSETIIEKIEDLKYPVARSIAQLPDGSFFIAGVAICTHLGDLTPPPPCLFHQRITPEGVTIWEDWSYGWGGAGLIIQSDNDILHKFQTQTFNGDERELKGWFVFDLDTGAYPAGVEFPLFGGIENHFVDYNSNSDLFTLISIDESLQANKVVFDSSRYEQRRSKLHLDPELNIVKAIRDLNGNILIVAKKQAGLESPENLIMGIDDQGRAPSLEH